MGWGIRVKIRERKKEVEGRHRKKKRKGGGMKQEIMKLVKDRERAGKIG